MRPEIRRRTISEGAVISIPVGIVALLFLITILFFLHLYYRSRRSHLVSRKPVDLLGSETTAPSVLSTASPGSWVTNYDKELPQTPKEVHITLDINSYPFRENSTRRRPTSLPHSSIESPANIHLHRKSSSFNILAVSLNSTTTSSEGNLRIANLTDEDTLSINQLSSPITGPHFMAPIEKRHHLSESLSRGSGVKESSPGSSQKDHEQTFFNAHYSRRSFNPSSIRKGLEGHTMSTPTVPRSPPTAKCADKGIIRDLKSKQYHSGSSQPPSKLAINIPVKFLYLDPSQKSAFSEKAPETALPPYSSPGNGHPLRLSMFT